MPDHQTSAADSLHALSAMLRSTDSISLGDLLKELGAHGFGVVVLVLGAASFIPGPAPVFGAALCAAGMALALGREVIWLPGRLRRRPLRAAHAIAIIDRVLPIVMRLERMLRRRWPHTLNGHARRLIGLACIANGIVIILPIPFGNTAPAISVLILSLGLVASDGVAVIAGLAASVVSVGIAVMLAVFGFDVIDRLFRGPAVQ